MFDFLYNHQYLIWMLYTSFVTFYIAVGISWFFNHKLYKVVTKALMNDFLTMLLLGATLGSLIAAALMCSADNTSDKIFVYAGQATVIVFGTLFTIWAVKNAGIKIMQFRKKYILKEY